MNGYERQQAREMVYTWLVAVLASVFLVFFCLVEENYAALAAVMVGIALSFMIGLGGEIAYYQEKRKGSQETKPQQ